jgi:serine protease AprX
MRKCILFIVTVIAVQTHLCAQGFFRVSFTDKNNSPWSLSSPEEFLSERAILRREKQGIVVDSLDLPVNPGYISQILELGATFIHASKWLNSITVKTEAENFPEKAGQLPFVRNVLLTKRTTATKSAITKLFDPRAPIEFDTVGYGSSAHQIAQLSGQFLHNQNFKGQGMHIAVLDAGFSNVDLYPVFDSLWVNGQILGIRNFAGIENPATEEHYHGMSVLSVMGGNIRNQLIGTAPKACYWLIRTEDAGSEYLIEEDNWAVGAEFADSAGVDIINSSLGYSTFDDPAMNHTYNDMNGRTTFVTRAANVAASRGILVFASAGNEGREGNSWKYIVAPSDGDSVIGVGAVNKDGVPAPFTSSGPASDGDVKPNVSAVGWNTIIQKNTGTIGTGNGTSYASPVVAGTAACLWQANPHANAFQIRNAIERSAHLYANPDSLLGYGIPDMKIADKILKTSILEQWANNEVWMVYPNPARDYIVIQKNRNASSGKVTIAFFSTDGKLLRKEIHPDASKIILHNLRLLPPGLWILQITSEHEAAAFKIKISH